MLTFQDCVSFSGLSEDIVAAIARHQSMPDVVACGLGSWLVTTAQGVAVIRHLLEAGIGAAERQDQVHQAKYLRQALEGLNAAYPPAPMHEPCADSTFNFLIRGEIPMAMHVRPPIMMTTLDVERLYALLDAVPLDCAGDVVDFLAEEVDRAEMVEPQRIARNVVTMRSRVLFQDNVAGATEATLVYPGAEDIEAGAISILTPVGSALIGLTEGQSIDFRTPSGRLRNLTAVKILFQPEACGRFDL